MNDQTTQVNHVTLGEWMVTMLIAAIPLVNIIMLFVWGFGSNTNPSKANWAKAVLIWSVIAIVLYFLVFATMISSLGRFRY
jgi:quinol-cytochrome oxidoreductase complex cytochrome b subunit